MEFNVGFTPVSITLNSQAEVDFFYTLLANAPDTLVGDFGLAEEVDELVDYLETEASDVCFPETYVDVEDFYPALDEPVEFCQGLAGCNTSMYEHKAQRIEQPMQREHPCKRGCEACTGCNAAESNYEPDAENTSSFKPFTVEVKSQGAVNMIARMLGGTDDRIDEAFGVDYDEAFELYEAFANKSDGGPFVNVEIN